MKHDGYRNNYIGSVNQKDGTILSKKMLNKLETSKNENNV